MQFERRVKTIMEPELDKIRNLFHWPDEPSFSSSDTQRFSILPTVMDSDPSVRYDTRIIPETDMPTDPVSYRPLDDEEQRLPNQEQLERGGSAPYQPWDIRKLWVWNMFDPDNRTSIFMFPGFSPYRGMVKDFVKNPDWDKNLEKMIRKVTPWQMRLLNGAISWLIDVGDWFRPLFNQALADGWFWDEDDPGDPRDPSVQPAPPIDSDVSVASMRNTFLECCTQMKSMIQGLSLGVLQPGQIKQELLRRFP